MINCTNIYLELLYYAAQSSFSEWGKKKKEIQRLKLVGKEGVLVSIALCIRLQKEGKTLQG